MSVPGEEHYLHSSAARASLFRRITAAADKTFFFTRIGKNAVLQLILSVGLNWRKNGAICRLTLEFRVAEVCQQYARRPAHPREVGCFLV